MTRTFLRTICPVAAVAAALGLAGCGGGGGGGGATAGITGKVLLIGVGSFLIPSPAATVSVGGASAQTDANGVFVLQSVPASGASVTIKASGYKDLTQALPALTANQVNDLGTIYLSSTGYTANITGTVLRSDTNAAVAGVLITLNGQKTTTLANGMFSMSGLPEGLGTAQDPNGQSRSEFGLMHVTDGSLEDRGVPIDFPLEAGANDLGNIFMSPPVGGIPGGPYDISGVVSLQGATDKSGTTVTLLSGGSTVGTFTTAADGGYGFWVVAGTYTLRAEHAGYQTKEQSVTLTSPDKPQTVNLTLTP